IPGHGEVGSKELQLAAELVDRLSGDWKPEKYTDDYREALLDLIQKKIESGGRMPAGAPTAKKQATKVIDLVSVLQESIDKAHKATGQRAKSRTAEKRHLKKAA